VPTHNVNLTQELDRFILDKIQSGRYEDVSEVVRAALRTLEREEQRFEALRTAIDECDSSGIAEGDVFASVRQTLELPSKRLSYPLAAKRANGAESPPAEGRPHRFMRGHPSTSPSVLPKYPPQH